MKSKEDPSSTSKSSGVKVGVGGATAFMEDEPGLL